MSDEEPNRQSSESSGTERQRDPEDLCGEVEGYIRAKPFRAMAIALCIGILIGRIIL
jgi:ElaB/YqjD/DUF883 family membrane-anchored ribosome-binding protein